MVISNSLVLDIIGVTIASIILIILLFKRRYRYWKDLGMEQMEPTIPFGNTSGIMFRKTTRAEWSRTFYNYLKSKKVKHGGAYLFYVPTYVPIDLDLIKHIMQIDFSHFMDHNLYVNEKDDPLTAHLFSLKGQKWRNLRTKLTPIFTSGKMKSMFPIMVQTSEELAKYLQKECDNGNPFEGKEISARFTTDIIGNCAFGIECNSIADPNTDFRLYGKRLFNLTTLETLSMFMTFVIPDICKYFGVRFFPKVATDFFWKIIKQTVDYREQTGFRRNDAMQLLLELKTKDDNDSVEHKLTFNELAAQAFVFFIGGFETSSTLMSFALLEVAINQDVQDKLREEIIAVLKKNDNEFTYTALQEMKYLDMVISETLRKYPPLPFLNRNCTKDYRIPNTDVILKKETRVLIPIHGIHYDPEYYPNPEVFDPTRFNEESKSKRHQFAYLPFGDGPRSCIGIRFGLMQAKIGLATIVKNFKIKVNPQTALPIKLDPAYLLTSVLGKVLLDLEKN